MVTEAPTEARDETEHYVLQRIGRIVLQRWKATPRSVDLATIVQWLTVQRRHAGGDLAVIEIIPAGIRPPTAEDTRLAMKPAATLKFVRGLHVLVCEGDEIESAIARGIARTVSFEVKDTLTTATTLDDAIEIAARYTAQESADVRAQFFARGIIEPPTK